MTTKQAIKYLGKRPLVEALWWFIENREDSWSSEVTFFLRERFRNEYQTP